MSKYENIVTEIDDNHKGIITKYVTEAIEVHPRSGNEGGCLVRTRVKLKILNPRILRILGFKYHVYISESVVYIGGVTVKQLKGDF